MEGQKSPAPSNNAPATTESGFTVVRPGQQVAREHPAGAAPVAPPSGSSTPGERRGRGRPKGSVNKIRLPAAATPVAAANPIAAETPIAAATPISAIPIAAAIPVAAAPSAPAAPRVDASMGTDFIPYTIIIPPGEDIATRILWFAGDMSPRAVCVMSAVGSISSYFLSNASGIVRNNEECDIQSLSGSFAYSENLRVGNINVVLTRLDGSVLAGKVVGPLISAYPIMLMIGSFNQYADQEVIKPGSESAPLPEDSTPSAAPQTVH